MAKHKNPNEGPQWIRCENCGVRRPETQLSERHIVSDGGLEAKLLACTDLTWCDHVKKERLALEN